MAVTTYSGPFSRRRLARAMVDLQGSISLAGPVAVGSTFYVSSTSTSASDSNAGTDSRRPLATIAAALALCTTNVGDTIVVMPRHTESISAAAGLSITKNGITIIGKGNGTHRPLLTWDTSTAAQIVISATNVLWKGFQFALYGIDAVVAAFSVTGTGVAFEECLFTISDGTTGCVLGILTAATAAQFRVENCRFVGPAVNAGTTCTACIKHEVGVDYVIKGNYFTGKMTQAILNATTLLRGTIDGNRFVIATGTVAITMAAASTPFIVNNRINVPSGTAPVVAAAGFMAGNVYSAAAGVTAGTASTF